MMADQYSEEDLEAIFDELFADSREFWAKRREGLEHLPENVGPEDFHANDFDNAAYWDREAAWENWRAYTNGNRPAILAAFLKCADGGVVPPDYMAEELRRLLYTLLAGRAKEWSEIFGNPRRKGVISNGLKRRAIMLDFFEFAQSRRYGVSRDELFEMRFRRETPKKCAEAMPVDEAFFEMLGERYEMSPATAKRFYYHCLEHFEPTKARYPEGLDDCPGL